MVLFELLLVIGLPNVRPHQFHPKYTVGLLQAANSFFGLSCFWIFNNCLSSCSVSWKTLGGQNHCASLRTLPPGVALRHWLPHWNMQKLFQGPELMEPSILLCSQCLGFPTAAPAAPAGLPAGLVNLSLQCSLLRMKRLCEALMHQILALQFCFCLSLLASGMESSDRIMIYITFKYSETARAIHYLFEDKTLNLVLCSEIRK